MLRDPQMKNYLFYFGYFGNRFRGIQKNTHLGRKDKTVARYLEESLLSLSPSNEPFVKYSSRTDAGVHSLCSTFSSFLCLPPMNIRPLEQSQEDYITATLNKYFENSNLDIRIFKTQIVPHTFHCQKAVERKTYLYRLAHLQVPNNSEFECQRFNELPLFETDRCEVIRRDLNLTAIHCACEILEGEHDFRYFMKKSNREYRILETVRTLNELKVVPGRPLFPPEYTEQYKNLKFWNVIVSSTGFLYNQVRRIVGLLVAVGEGKVSLKEVEDTLLNPRKDWDSRAYVIGPSGLYLINTKYPPEAFLKKV